MNAIRTPARRTPRQVAWRAMALLPLLLCAPSCSFLADEVVKLDAAGPVAEAPTPPSATVDRP